MLEIDFTPDAGPARGLRELTRVQLDALCTAAKCTIISQMSNDHLDSYVLSESSLFVYSHKIILKTCGTTTLLMTLEPLIEYTTALGMKMEWMAYTRKDFQQPLQQKFPHRDPAEEVRARTPPHSLCTRVCVCNVRAHERCLLPRWRLSNCSLTS